MKIDPIEIAVLIHSKCKFDLYIETNLYVPLVDLGESTLIALHLVGSLYDAGFGACVNSTYGLSLAFEPFV